MYAEKITETWSYYKKVLLPVYHFCVKDGFEFCK